MSVMASLVRPPCPTECGAKFCTLACVLQHRDMDHGEDHAQGGPGDRQNLARGFRGQEPLSAMQWHWRGIWKFSFLMTSILVKTCQDMFTEAGRRDLQILIDDETLFDEHWAPECKLFSKARGKPIVLENGKRIAGPQPVRDHKHLMGFPWLSNEAKGRVRRSNNMVLKALRTGKQQNRPNLY